MTTLVWDDSDALTYETGIRKGVLYTIERPPYWIFLPSFFSWKVSPWNGLISVAESEKDASLNEVFYDGRKTVNEKPNGVYEAKISALTIPHDFGSLLGESEARPGVSLTGQPKTRFNFTYQTLVGKTDYKIHIIWNALLTQTQGGYSTNGSTVTPTTFSWTLSTLPSTALASVDKPVSHLILDSRTIDPTFLSATEDILYGSALHDPYLPTQAEFTTALAEL